MEDHRTEINALVKAHFDYVNALRVVDHPTEPSLEYSFTLGEIHEHVHQNLDLDVMPVIELGECRVEKRWRSTEHVVDEMLEFDIVGYMVLDDPESSSLYIQCFADSVSALFESYTNTSNLEGDYYITCPNKPYVLHFDNDVPLPSYETHYTMVGDELCCSFSGKVKVCCIRRGGVF